MAATEDPTRERYCAQVESEIRDLDQRIANATSDRDALNAQIAGLEQTKAECQSLLADMESGGTGGRILRVVDGPAAGDTVAVANEQNAAGERGWIGDRTIRLEPASRASGALANDAPDRPAGAGLLDTAAGDLRE